MVALASYDSEKGTIIAPVSVGEFDELLDIVDLRPLATPVTNGPLYRFNPRRICDIMSQIRLSAAQAVTARSAPPGHKGAPLRPVSKKLTLMNCQLTLCIPPKTRQGCRTPTKDM